MKFNKVFTKREENFGADFSAEFLYMEILGQVAKGWLEALEYVRSWKGSQLGFA